VVQKLCLDKLYCCKFILYISVHQYCKLVLTNESPSKITFMDRIDQSQLGLQGIWRRTWSLIAAR
jgi:hypothetical protein